ncbi:hypothetical protein T4C_3776 [Trichinella pseudospiralis]|uniref:Uncharacterized protein n=1 Tax=Trichinella pseudospiralis TaxID=6337 RepID=A0A0V1JFZ9_TRIPS|nr:hypothetical protein T4E_12322 [Trichinella pseudospiralis]KRZ33866.1 hypothetical protein T4C_3776 [Trichinella pseudospiralis]
MEKKIIIIGSAETVKKCSSDETYWQYLARKSRFWSMFKRKERPAYTNVSACHIYCFTLERLLCLFRNKGSYWLEGPPLTSFGERSARLYAQSLVSTDVLNAESLGNCVYAAPSLGCVQTLNEILNVVDPTGKVKIRIEPALRSKINRLKVKPNLFISGIKRLSFEYFHRVDYSYQSKNNSKDFNKRIEMFKQSVLNHPGNVVLLSVKDWILYDVYKSICNTDKCFSPSVVDYIDTVDLLRTFIIKIIGNEWALLNTYLPPFSYEADMKCVISSQCFK